MYKTAREVYIDVLTELVKEEAPTFYMEDYNYYFNKAISEYMKLRYELFELTQQFTDDLRFWKESYPAGTAMETALDDVHAGDDPLDKPYRHLIGCTLTATTTRPVIGCDQLANTSKSYKVTRMSTSIKNGLLNNVYLEPKFYRPYFDITNNKIRIDVGLSLPSWVEISNIVIEYLRHPVKVDLLEEEVAADIDESQVLEFTSDVGDEIVKILIRLLLERGSDPRLEPHVGINQTINDPVAKGAQQK